MPVFALAASDIASIALHGLGWDRIFWATVVVIAILLTLSALLSGAEAALTAASRSKLKARADKGDGGAMAALQLTDHGEKLIGTLHLGNIAIRILVVSLTTALLVPLMGITGIAIAALAMTLLLMIFAEVLPRKIALTAPEDLATRVARPVAVLSSVMSPFVGTVRLIVRGLLRLMGKDEIKQDNLFSVQDEIAGALALGHSSGSVLKEERDRLLGALDLADRWVEEVMLHRSGIEMIDANLPPEEVLNRVLSSPHTRLPVFKGERENVIGVIHAKDLLRAVNRTLRQHGPEALTQLSVLDVAMPPYFVPETTSLDEQLHEFLKRRSHFALVVDEYGSLRGLITLEDILEEIVGEIADEHDRGEVLELKKTRAGDYIVDGAMTIRDLNRALDWSLPDDEANTVAGLVIHMAQSIPMPGQVFSFFGFRFEIVSRRENRITRLKIRPLVAAEPAEAAG